MYTAVPFTHWLDQQFFSRRAPRYSTGTPRNRAGVRAPSRGHFDLNGVVPWRHGASNCRRFHTECRWHNPCLVAQQQTSEVVMTPGNDAMATFNPQLPLHHDQFHPALFAAAWTSGAPQFDVDGSNSAPRSPEQLEDVPPESIPTVVPPRGDRHSLPTVRPAPVRAPTRWERVEVRSGRLAFGRSRDCHGLVRSFFDLI
jgi:hypothetical protein